jgi:DNA-binding NarL/FixJ family response regulator
MIKVLLADPHTVLRHGLRLILQEDPLLAVIGEAATANELICQMMILKPDVVVTGLQFPDFSGIKAIEQIRVMLPQTQVLVLTISDRSEDMLAACKAGAKGYLLKSVRGDDVIQAIHQIAAGQAVLPPRLATRLLDELAASTRNPESLTEREIDVLQHITQGFCNKEIACNLNISENTVKTHIRRILAKLNLRNRTEAASYAVQSDLFLRHSSQPQSPKWVT